MKVCSVEGCDQIAKRKSYCDKHFQRWKRHGDPLKTLIGKQVVCSVKGCCDDAKKNMKTDNPLCIKHYGRWQRYGDPEKLLREDWGKGYVTSHGYIRRYVGGDYKFEHRLVMEGIIGRELKRHEQVHHINGDRADNRPENLELWNTSHPSGQKIEDVVEWSIEQLKKYKPEVLKDEYNG